jgi:hypothetical protein
MEVRQRELRLDAEDLLKPLAGEIDRPELVLPEHRVGRLRIAAFTFTHCCVRAARSGNRRGRYAAGKRRLTVDRT